VTTKARSPLLPDVPTMAEAGVPGFESATNYTLFAPKAVSADIQKKLSETGNEVVSDAGFREKMLKLGIVPAGGPQTEVLAKMPVEMKRWADVISKGNIKPS
jgi:tripartite-type tricarboxylate transporter receptor subunit TctC